MIDYEALIISCEEFITKYKAKIAEAEEKQTDPNNSAFHRIWYRNVIEHNKKNIKTTEKILKSYRNRQEEGKLEY